MRVAGTAAVSRVPVFSNTRRGQQGRTTDRHPHIGGAVGSNHSVPNIWMAFLQRGRPYPLLSLFCQETTELSPFVAWAVSTHSLCRFAIGRSALKASGYGNVGCREALAGPRGQAADRNRSCLLRGGAGFPVSTYHTILVLKNRCSNCSKTEPQPHYASHTSSR